MKLYSTREAAKRLGISLMTLQRYIAAKKIRPPRLKRVGGVVLRLWAASDVERVRKRLPRIKNGRKKKKA
jgi:excisionase family DNA binding protein